MLRLTYPSPPDAPPVFMDAYANNVLTEECHRSMPHFNLHGLLHYFNSMCSVIMPYICAVFPKRNLKLWPYRLAHVNVHKIIEQTTSCDWDHA